jgi:hypothetical protein
VTTPTILELRIGSDATGMNAVWPDHAPVVATIV